MLSPTGLGVSWCTSSADRSQKLQQRPPGSEFSAFIASSSLAPRALLLAPSHRTANTAPTARHPVVGLTVAHAGREVGRPAQRWRRVGGASLALGRGNPHLREAKSPAGLERGFEQEELEMKELCSTGALEVPLTMEVSHAHYRSGVDRR
jgi:hypothetical protein